MVVKMFKYVLLMLLFVLGVDSNASTLQRHCSTVNGKDVCVYLDEKENSALNKIRKRNNSNYSNNNNVNLSPKVNTDVYNNNNSYGASSKAKSKSSYSSVNYKNAKVGPMVYIVLFSFILVSIMLIVFACKEFSRVLSGVD